MSNMWPEFDDWSEYEPYIGREQLCGNYWRDLVIASVAFVIVLTVTIAAGLMLILN